MAAALISKKKGERGALSIMACDSGRVLAQRIVDNMNQLIRQEKGEDSPALRLTDTEEVTFANGEIKTVIKENIRGDDHYIVQCMDDPLSDKSINDNLMALLTAVNAAFQSDADSITVVIPQFPYSRQERKKTREGITAKQVAQFLEISGANRVITLDVHAEAIMGFFNTAKLEDLHASRTIINYFQQSYDTSNLIISSADVGGAEKARFYSKAMQTDMAVVDKARDYSHASVVESMRLVGDVRGKDVLIPDDMISTGGTIINAARLLKDRGAEKIYVACSLPFFNGNAVEKLSRAHEEGLIERVIGTDAVMHGEKFRQEHPWYDEISIAPLFAHVIYNINAKRSVSELLR
ncbi:MAG TPA: ribose-phosphate pyrophosphokinase [Caldithrix abyssi]|uniref:ribose-phosphate diphosphokinase n=1 Tax=Caldithrix abyssi TaxID=187145 RepID=A0A7V5UFC0_CALAY|nr:ribose-phosphate pyrophosphokinase [Caldithrix abyssi]